MRVVGRGQLQAFGDKHADARKWIENWLADVELSSWGSPHDVKQRYTSVSFLGDGTTIVNVRGNRYRLEVRVAYRTKIVVIQWIGTHAEYNKRNDQR